MAFILKKYTPISSHIQSFRKMYLLKIYFELQCVCVCVCVVTRPSLCLVGMSCWPTDTEKTVQIIPGEAPSLWHGRMDGDMVPGSERRRTGGLIPGLSWRAPESRAGEGARPPGVSSRWNAQS